MPASVSAVLGGFALAFLGVIISGPERSRARELTAALALPCSCAFVLCALGWSLSAVWLASPLASTESGSTLPEFLVGLHTALSPVFLLGTFLFFWALGASGWIYSRRLGLFSSVIGVLATIGAYFVVEPFLLSS